MTLGERCDEIVRLIDETLMSCAPVAPVRGARPRAAVADRCDGELEELWPKSA